MTLVEKVATFCFSSFIRNKKQFWFTLYFGLYTNLVEADKTSAIKDQSVNQTTKRTAEEEKV